MTDSLRVRRFQPGDRRRVRELHEEAMRDVGAFFEDAPDPDLDDVEGTYIDAGGEFLVGEVDGRIVAMGAIRPATGYLPEFLDDLPERTAELKRMRVDPDHQRRGYGQRIYDELEQSAREAGFAELVLDTMPKQSAAQRFYEANGFERADRIEATFDDVSLTLLCYRKPLDPP